MANDITRIAAWLQPQEILLGVDVRDRKHALEVVGEAVDCSHSLEPGSAFRALWRREQAASTGLGGGFAIPHASVAGITTPLTLFMRPQVAIAFDAPDRQPVSQLLAIVAPVDGAKQDHLQLLALVAQLFSDVDFRRQLDGAHDVAQAADVFRMGIARVTDGIR
jgi:PTS system nitrogen regulatory IIA component